MTKKQSKNILASQQDQEIFFKALVNADKPSSKLVAAARKHKKQYQQSRNT